MSEKTEEYSLEITLNLTVKGDILEISRAISHVIGQSIKRRDHAWTDWQIKDYEIKKIKESEKFTSDFLVALVNYNESEIKLGIPPTVIRCIFNENDIDIENCKECSNQCKKYKEIEK